MPALPVVGNVLKVVLRGYVDNLLENIWENVLHWRWSGSTPDSTALNNIASQIATAWSTHMAPEAPSPTSLRNVQVTDLTSASSAEGNWDGSTFGTRGDDSIPANAAALISYPIDLRYRGGHPRTYLMVGGNADLQGAAEWSTLFQAEFRQHWVDFLNGVAIISVPPGTSMAGLVAVFYHGHGGPYSEGTVRVQPIVQPINFNICVAQPNIASQRRRTEATGTTVLAKRQAILAQRGAAL